MLTILYEDEDIIVPVKPAGLQSQSVHSFEPDMVSEIRKHIAGLSTRCPQICRNHMWELSTDWINQ